jgi:hypothetical protein
MEQEPITYYPGDLIRLQLVIEHDFNFREGTLKVVFKEWLDVEGATFPPRITLPVSDPIVEEVGDDGLRTSEVYFEAVAEHDPSLPAGDQFRPGNTYEFDYLIGETAGGTEIRLYPGESQVLVFRYAHEPTHRRIGLKDARFLAPSEE